jgi:hypothetical protein
MANNTTLDKFQQFIDKTEKNVIALDFDGVIHNHDKGFHDGTIYGNPIEGTKEALEILSRDYQLIIYSCKCNPNRPLINGKGGIELMWEWLEKWDLKNYISDIVVSKPNAICYIDDKGIRFESWEQILNKFNEKPN